MIKIILQSTASPCVLILSNNSSVIQINTPIWIESNSYRLIYYGHHWLLKIRNYKTNGFRIIKEEC